MKEGRDTRKLIEALVLGSLLTLDEMLQLRGTLTSSARIKDGQTADDKERQNGPPYDTISRISVAGS